MLELDGSNALAIVGSILNRKKLSDYQIQKRKFLYIEGLIRFLEIYAQNEIGNVEVDIEKVALWVNSPGFENVDIYKITNIHKVFEMLTDDLIERNITLHRFLKLSRYQLLQLEHEHQERLLHDFHADCETYPCLKCIWYNNEMTSFGRISKCKLPREYITRKTSWYSSNGYHDITAKRNRECKYVTTVNDKESFISKYVGGNEDNPYRTKEVLTNLDRFINEWNEKVNNLDNSYIPIIIPDSSRVSLDEERDIFKDFGRAYNNKKTKEDMKMNLRFAVLLECMIKFVEVYAQTEMGSDYNADISKIARFVCDYSKKNFFTFTSKEEIYERLEGFMIEDEDFFMKYIARKGDYYI